MSKTTALKLFVVLGVTGAVCLLVFGIQILFSWGLGQPVQAWGVQEAVWIGVIGGLLGAISSRAD